MEEDPRATLLALFRAVTGPLENNKRLEVTRGIEHMVNNVPHTATALMVSIVLHVFSSFSVF